MKNRFECLLEEKAGKLGCRTLMIDAKSGGEKSSEDFLKLVREYAETLQRYGVRAGDRVLLMAENSIAFAAAFFAVTFCHAVVVPVNTGLLNRELHYLIEDTQAAGILIQPKYLQQEGEMEGERFGNVGEELDFFRLADNAERDLPDTTAMLLYTSGTTGKPKGVMLSFDNLLAKTGDIIEAHQLKDSDRVLCCLPWFHINGLVITLLTSIVSEQTIVIAGKFSVSAFWNYVEAYRITWFSGVPTMYSHLLSRGIPEYGKKSCLRFARSASSALPKAVLLEFENKCGVPIIESYGITEGCAQITSNPLPPGPRKAGSVGIPYGNLVKVMAGTADAEREAEPGETGEVWIRGENVTCGYYKKPEETKRAFSAGWFKTGDLGYLDEDGYLFLNGRVKELINRAGEKFSPLEIDEVLYELEAVELAAAVGVPDPVYGEEVAAFIKVREQYSLSAEEVQEWCRKKLAPYKVPRKICFVSELPQGGNGKIQRLKLIDIYTSV